MYYIILCIYIININNVLCRILGDYIHSKETSSLSTTELIRAYQCNISMGCIVVS